jgi:hypothetical protein
MASFRPAESYLNFDDFSPSGAGTGGAGAAGMATVGQVNRQLRSASPDFGGLGARSVLIDGAMRRAASDAEADVTAKGMIMQEETEQSFKDYAQQVTGNAKRNQASTFGNVLKTGLMLGGMALMSDKTIKNTIENISDALSTLRELRPVSFYYNEEYSSNPERLHHGFIAQEYQKVLPDATYFDESNGKLCIDTGDLIGILVRAVQELEVKVTRLEAANALTGVK